VDPLVGPLNSKLAEDERVNGRRFANQIIQWLDGHMQKVIPQNLPCMCCLAFN